MIAEKAGEMLVASLVMLGIMLLFVWCLLKYDAWSRKIRGGGPA